MTFHADLKQMSSSDGDDSVLVSQLSEGSEDSKVEALRAMENLAVNSEEQRSRISVAGALQPLVTMLKEGSGGAKERAARACCQQRGG